MGGGQAGAPADDDHVPWLRPPAWPPRLSDAVIDVTRSRPANVVPACVPGQERAGSRRPVQPDRPLGGAGAQKAATEFCTTCTNQLTNTFERSR